jgi:hypothetical protein
MDFSGFGVVPILALLLGALLGAAV